MAENWPVAIDIDVESDDWVDMSNYDVYSLYMSEDESDDTNYTWPFTVPWVDKGRE
jgi:hypothetical protein